jgi:hypothetical protein
MDIESKGVFFCLWRLTAAMQASCVGETRLYTDSRVRHSHKGDSIKDSSRATNMSTTQRARASFCLCVIVVVLVRCCMTSTTKSEFHDSIHNSQPSLKGTLTSYILILARIPQHSFLVECFFGPLWTILPNRYRASPTHPRIEDQRMGESACSAALP